MTGQVGEELTSAPCLVPGEGQGANHKNQANANGDLASQGTALHLLSFSQEVTGAPAI